MRYLEKKTEIVSNKSVKRLNKMEARQKLYHYLI